MLGSKPFSCSVLLVELDVVVVIVVVSVVISPSPFLDLTTFLTFLVLDPPSEATLVDMMGTHS